MSDIKFDIDYVWLWVYVIWITCDLYYVWYELCMIVIMCVNVSDRDYMQFILYVIRIMCDCDYVWLLSCVFGIAYDWYYMWVGLCVIVITCWYD